MAVQINTVTFWVMKPYCSLIWKHQCSAGTHSLSPHALTRMQQSVNTEGHNGKSI